MFGRVWHLRGRAGCWQRVRLGWGSCLRQCLPACSQAAAPRFSLGFPDTGNSNMQSAGSRGGRGAPSKGRGSPEGPGLHTEGVDGRAPGGGWPFRRLCVSSHLKKPHGSSSVCCNPLTRLSLDFLLPNRWWLSVVLQPRAQAHRPAACGSAAESGAASRLKLIYTRERLAVFSHILG